MKVLVLNAGSSSVKFELIETSLEAIEQGTEVKYARGLIDKIGLSSSTVRLTVPGRDPHIATPPIWDHASAVKQIVNVLADPEHGVIESPSEIDAVGHRVVHGGEYFSSSTLIDDDAILKIRECFELAPLHNPHNLNGILQMRLVFPERPHVAVFDTSFHQTMPDHAYLYGLPYDVYQKHKVRRYGFHGTSHRFMIYTLERKHLKRPRAEFNAVTVHLGNGSSVAAVDGGRSVDTSMGFTPLEGLMMGTRTGDVDAAAVLYLIAKEEVSLHEMESILNRQSGLKGLSGVSSDVRELLEAGAGGNERALLALRAFAYRVRKYIGAYIAALGGADAIAFAGGIGENAVPVRHQILSGLDRLGIVLDEKANGDPAANGWRISAAASAIPVFVVPTDEELVIARDTVRCIAGVQM